SRPGTRAPCGRDGSDTRSAVEDGGRPRRAADALWDRRAYRNDLRRHGDPDLHHPGLHQVTTTPMTSYNQLKSMRRRARLHAFTLVEMLLVLVILAVLAAI